MTDPAHPVAPVSAARAVDNAQRLASLDQLRRLTRDHADQIQMFGYHDVEELPRNLGGAA